LCHGLQEPGTSLTWGGDLPGSVVVGCVFVHPKKINGHPSKRKKVLRRKKNIGHPELIAELGDTKTTITPGNWGGASRGLN